MPSTDVIITKSNQHPFIVNLTYSKDCSNGTRAGSLGNTPTWPEPEIPKNCRTVIGSEFFIYHFSYFILTTASVGYITSIVNPQYQTLYSVVKVLWNFGQTGIWSENVRCLTKFVACDGATDRKTNLWTNKQIKQSNEQTNNLNFAMSTSLQICLLDILKMFLCFPKESSLNYSSWPPKLSHHYRGFHMFLIQ